MLNDIRLHRIDALAKLVRETEHLYAKRHSFHFIEILEREVMFSESQYLFLKRELYNEVIELPRGL